MKKRNAVVAQSGGPSPVINSSLAGVIDACRDRSISSSDKMPSTPCQAANSPPMWSGKSRQDRRELELLRTTTSAGAIGTCRYKLKADQTEDFQRIVEVLQAHDVGYFFYIGGNDSMDTAQKVAELARRENVDLVCTGVPKTIDNDVGDDRFTLIDHTPGYGSAARYWACITKEVDQENRGMCPSESVSVLQAMGRKAGFIPAAARLADPDREMPLQLYLVEGKHNLESLTENVNRQLNRSGRCIVVVSEGFEVGSLGEKHDGFGHVEYGASQTTVAQVVINHLNRVGLRSRGYATGQVPGVLQRSTSIYASPVDLQEAYEVGRHAVQVGIREGTGWMATILRRPGSGYQAYYDKVALGLVAASARRIPEHWLSADRLDVSDEFVRYARPLIGEDWAPIPLENGVQRFARLKISFLDKKLPAYVPQKHR